MSICWLVDELLSERAYETGYSSLHDAALELGHRVYKTKYKPFSEHPFPVAEGGYPFEKGACVVTHGTVQFCKQVEQWCGRLWTPGMYFNANVKSFSKFAAYIGGDLLNDDYNILPFGEVCRRLRQDDAVFIKPESGLKEFVGQLIYGSDPAEKTLRELSPYGLIDPTTLCVIANPKDIKAEFRYVIVDKKVITGSEYRWDNVLDVRRDTHPICDAMAKKIAEADWQADTCYACDVALVADKWTGKDSAKVIELNAFSSSGLYACDTYKIVEAVSVAAEREHLGME